MAISTVASVGNANNFVDYPFGILAGDLIVLTVVGYTGSPAAPLAAIPNFQKQIESIGTAPGQAQVAVYTRAATGVLSGTLGGPTGGVALGMVVLRGADTTTPFDLTTATLRANYVQIHQFTPITTGDPCTILWVDGVVGDNSGEANTFPAGVLVNANGTFSGVFMALTTQATAGLTNPPGRRTFPQYLSGVGFSLPVRPAGTPPPRPIVAVTGAARAPYGRPVVGAATVTATAPSATVIGYQWTVTGPVLSPAPTLTGGTTATCTYKPTAAGTPGIGGPAAQFTATCVVTDSNGRTGTAAFTTAVRAATLVRAGGVPWPAARRGRWNGTAH